MKIGRTYPVSYFKHTNPGAENTAHPLVTANHCLRCELHTRNPNNFDSLGNIIPAVPASPLPSQPQSFRPVTPAQVRYTVYGGGVGGEYSYDLIPFDEDTLAKEEAPDFIGPRGTYKVEKLGWDWKNDPDIEKGYYEPCEYNDANLASTWTCQRTWNRQLSQITTTCTSTR
jgi:hypothetical protein